MRGHVVVVVNYRDRTTGIGLYLAHLPDVSHRQHITANPHPRPVKNQLVIVVNYRDQIMVINHLNDAGLHRQHRTAYPHARPVRRQVLIVVNYIVRIRLCEFGTSYSKATCATQAARNCINMPS